VTGDPYGSDPSPNASPDIPARSAGRYAYLVGRLRGRQITMEEATELFTLQQQILRAQAMRLPPPPPPPPGPGIPRVATSTGLSGMDQDLFWVGLPALAAAAGIFAAMLKRSHSPPGPPMTAKDPKASP
jgi:hypothetical protein